MERTHIKTDSLTYCEIDFKALKYNLRQIAKVASKNTFALPTRTAKGKFNGGIGNILAVIKADAYGHGVKRIAPFLEQEGIGFFAVSDVAEGMALRQIGIKKPILLFESTLPHYAQQIIRYTLTPTVCTAVLAESLNRYASRQNKKIDIHIKVDTGMGRLGVWHEEAFDFIQKISRMRHLRIQGIFTHFPSADTDRSFTEEQIGIFSGLVERLDRANIVIPYIHAANSMGLAGYQTRMFNLFRPGLMLYGLYPEPGLKQHILLKPVMSVRSRVIFLKKMGKGRSVSYGRTHLLDQDAMVATVPIGYNDGYFRVLSNRASVLVGGVRCPVIGRVTMDQIMVDVTTARAVKLGTPVTILGKRNQQAVSADDLAVAADTINYEIVCSLGNRLPKVFK